MALFGAFTSADRVAMISVFRSLPKKYSLYLGAGLGFSIYYSN